MFAWRTVYTIIIYSTYLLRMVYKSGIPWGICQRKKCRGVRDIPTPTQVSLVMLQSVSPTHHRTGYVPVWPNPHKSEHSSHSPMKMQCFISSESVTAGCGTSGLGRTEKERVRVKMRTFVAVLMKHLCQLNSARFNKIKDILTIFCNYCHIKINA